MGTATIELTATTVTGSERTSHDRVADRGDRHRPGDLRGQPAHPLGRRPLRVDRLPRHRAGAVRPRRARRRARLHVGRRASRAARSARAIDWDVAMLDVAAAVAHVAPTGPVAVDRLLLGWVARLAVRRASCRSPPRSGTTAARSRSSSTARRAARCMLHFGALDAAIPLDEVAKIGEQYPDVEIHVYDEADHGFNCDARGDVPPGVSGDGARAHARLPRSPTASSRDHRLPRSLHHGAAAARRLPRRPAGAAASTIPTPSARRARSRSPTTRSATASKAPSCKLQRERGTDLTIFSPRASWMGHHIGNEHTSRFWTEHCNDLIRRVCDLYPANFAPVCQLPQSPGAPIDVVGARAASLRRARWGSSAATSTPIRAAGTGPGPPLDDRSFWPLYEAMCELDVPAMIHVSATCNPNFHTTGSHYLGADTTAFMQVLTSGLFKDFPTTAVHHPPRRRRGAVPLGSLPGHRPGHGDGRRSTS